MEIWVDGDTAETGTKIGELPIPVGGDAWRALSTPVANATGRHAVFLRFAADADGQSLGDLRSFRFVKAE